MSKYANAIGIMDFEVGGIPLEFKPTFKHKRKFRALIMDEKLSKDKVALFDQFSNYVLEMVREFDPQGFEVEGEDKIRDFIETYIMDLFKEFMIAYKYTTKEKWAEQEAQGTRELKNKLASV
jgi:hypothetical protein